jgi:hypothetical protein
MASESARVLTDQFSAEQARDRAEQEKMSVFGNLNKLFFRPRLEDIEIARSEKRYEPFWYVAAQSEYSFDRRSSYRIPVARGEVQSVTLEGSEVAFEVPAERALNVKVIEHCYVERQREIAIDAVTAARRDFQAHLTFPSEAVEQLETFQPEEASVVPPQVRASHVVRDLLAEMMKEAMHAEVVHKDRVEITEITLYLRPLYAFEYRWIAKDKEALAEFDAITGEMHRSTTQLGQHLGRVLSSELLFDVGADAVELLVPGGGIVLKVGRALVDRQRKSLAG